MSRELTNCKAAASSVWPKRNKSRSVQSTQARSLARDRIAYADKDRPLCHPLLSAVLAPPQICNTADS